MNTRRRQRAPVIPFCAICGRIDDLTMRELISPDMGHALFCADCWEDYRQLLEEEGEIAPLPSLQPQQRDRMRHGLLPNAPAPPADS